MHHLVEHWGDVLTGMAFMSILGYAVNAAPTPENVWLQWFIGIFKFAVGQWLSARNMVRGQDTLIAAVPRGQGTGSGTAGGATTKVEKSSVDVTDDTITVKDMKQTTTVIPKPKEGE